MCFIYFLIPNYLFLIEKYIVSRIHRDTKSSIFWWQMKNIYKRCKQFYEILVVLIPGHSFRMIYIYKCFFHWNFTYTFLKKIVFNVSWKSSHCGDILFYLFIFFWKSWMIWCKITQICLKDVQFRKKGLK